MKPPRLTWQSTGAQVLTAEIGGHQLLYCSPLHDPNARRAARGGVPVLFPQFADRGPLKKHGWARDVEWELTDEHIGDDIHSVNLRLETNAETCPDWHYNARLDINVCASSDSLSLSLEVRNTGTNSFDWSGGLHPYWAVDDLLTCKVKGVKGTSTLDRFNPNKIIEEADLLRFNHGPYECLFESAAALELDTGNHIVELSFIDFDGWMIWNPGASESRKLQDLPPDHWKRFICIEPLALNKSTRLRPGDSFKGGLIARVRKSN